MSLLYPIKRLFFNYLKQSFLLLLFLSSNIISSQKFDKVDTTVRAYSSKTITASDLAKKINNDFITDIEKVRALYIYLTHTVKYDINDYKYGAKDYSFAYSSKKELEEKIRKRDLEIIHNTLSNKRAICEGYSITFKEVCAFLGIRCEIISGHTRTLSTEIGELPLIEKHAWNAVYLNSKWNFIDTTWGSGYSRDSNHWIHAYDEHYFFTNPKELITSHFPEKKKWQLLKVTKTEKQFTSQPHYASLFFKERTDLISPKSGIISSNKNHVVIKLKNANPAIEYGYAFENDYYLTSIIPEFNNNVATLKIPLKGKKNTSLNILNGTEMILQYKVQ